MRERPHEQGARNASVETRSTLLSIAEDGNASLAGNDGVGSQARSDTYGAGRWRSLMSTPLPGLMAKWSDALTCPIAVMSCIILTGMRAVPASVRTRCTRTWNGDIRSCGECGRRVANIIDTKPDPRKPRIVKVVEPETRSAARLLLRPLNDRLHRGGRYRGAQLDHPG